MKTLYILLLAAAPLAVLAQTVTVQSLGAANVAIGWHPANLTDSLRVDVDADGAPDIVFKSAYTAPSGPGAPSFTRFIATTAPGSGAELALDANEFDSLHRFVTGDPIGPGLLWQGGSGFLYYTITGNGGTGGRGFFRNNADGFVAIRKRMGNQMRYWWFYIGPRIASGSDWVSYYASANVVLATKAPALPALVRAFPNPATTHWDLANATNYELYDYQGRLVRCRLATPTTRIEAQSLPSGVYWLVIVGADGVVSRQRIVKE